MTEANERKLAKRLASLMVEHPDLTMDALRPLVDQAMANSQSAARRKRFYKLLAALLRREIARDTLTIESVTPLSEAQTTAVRTHFQSSNARPLQVNSVESPDLIAGIRVRHGDTVYDASIQGRLAAFASSIH